MDEAPERDASAKVAQHLAVAVQVAEAVIRMRQQHTERRAAATEQTAAGARAERTAQHTADRMVWSPALDADWTGQADLHDLGRAWGAAAGWADTDPAANVAATRVETRLSEMAPNAMARFDELRTSGTDRIEAMRGILANVAAQSSQRTRVFVGEPGQSDTAQGATAGEVPARADTAAYQARQSEATPDDPGTPWVDEHAEGVAAAVSRRDENDAWQADADAAAGFAGRRTTPGGHPHPADLAAESYPRRYVEVTPAAAGKPAAAVAVATKSTTRTLSR